MENITDKIAIEEERLKKYYRIRDIQPKPLASSKYGNWFYAARYISQRRENELFAILINVFNYLFIDKVNILDLGCGNGNQLSEWLKYGAEHSRLYGIDMLRDRIYEAKDKLPQAHLVCGNAVKTEYEDKFFHIITLNTVLSSIIDPDVRKLVCKEAVRVMADKGLIIIFDFMQNKKDNDNKNNILPLGYEGIKELFPDMDLYFRTFTPMYLLTSKNPKMWFVRLLDWLKIWNVHFICVAVRKGRNDEKV